MKFSHCPWKRPFQQEGGPRPKGIVKSSLQALTLTVVAGARGVGELHGAGPGPGGARHHREGHQRAGEGGHQVYRAGKEGPKFKIKLTLLRAG